MATTPIGPTIRFGSSYFILGDTDPVGSDGIRLNGVDFAFADNPFGAVPTPTAGTVTDMRLFVDGTVMMFVSGLPSDDLPSLVSAFAELGGTPTEADVISILAGAFSIPREVPSIPTISAIRRCSATCPPSTCSDR